MSTVAEQPKKGSLIAIGVLEIVLGLLACLLAFGGYFVSRAHPEAAIPGASARTLIFWLGIAAALITFAVGTIQAKRWARKLMLTFSWMGLVGGAFLVVFLVLWLPGMEESVKASMVAHGRHAARGSSTFMVLIPLIMAVPFVLVPGIFVMFYGNTRVAKVFEVHDPKASWTDRCPTPVLVCIAYWASGSLWSLVALLTSAYRFPVPIFGLLLYGWVGAAMGIVGGVLAVYVAWGLFQLKPSAWWAALGLTAFYGYSAVDGFSKVFQLETFERMQLPQATMDMIKNSGMLSSLGSNMRIVLTLASCISVGYLLFLRRYFVNRTLPPAACDLSR